MSLEMVARAALAADLDPSPEQARQWVQQELAKDEYYDGRSMLERIMQWIAQRISDLLESQRHGPGAGFPPIVTALLVVLIVVGLIWVLRKVRVEQRTLTEKQSVLGDSVLSSEQFRARADVAFSAGRWDGAVLDYTRAMAREADDRTLLTDAPGLTAHEIGAQLSVVFPDHGQQVLASMDLFDAVLYGRNAPARSDAELVRDTDQALRRARPVLETPPQALTVAGGDR